MTAVLIPVYDLFFMQVVKNPQGQQEAILSFNEAMMTADLVRVLKRPNVTLYVLLPCESGREAEVELFSSHGMRYRKNWRGALLPLLRAILEPQIERSLLIYGSFDLGPVLGDVFPREALWKKQHHLHRWLFTYITPAPSSLTLCAYRLQHFQLQNSYISNDKLMRVLSSQALHRQARQAEKIHPRNTLVICDVDHTVLDNLSSSLSRETRLNKAVVSSIKVLCDNLVLYGHALQVWLMSARMLSVDEQFQAVQHPFSMRSVAHALTRELHQPVLLNKERSFSCPVHVKGVKKTRKLEHLLKLFENDVITDTFSSVLLVDDCPYETEPSFVEVVASVLKEQYQMILTVLSVDRFGYAQSSQELLGVVPVDELLIPNVVPRRWSLISASSERGKTETQAAAYSAPR